MDDDDLPRRKEYPLSTAKLSKTPSWIMLGFVLGALFVLALPPLRKKAPTPETVRVEFVRPPAPRESRPLSDIEGVFAVWGEHSTWFNNTTEVALWNSKERAFTDFYEVRRFGDDLYFRSISSLTRRVVTHGKPLPESPLQFTETEEQYREWVEHGRVERPLDPAIRPRAVPSEPTTSRTTRSPPLPSVPLEKLAPPVVPTPSATPPRP